MGGGQDKEYRGRGRGGRQGLEGEGQQRRKRRKERRKSWGNKEGQEADKGTERPEKKRGMEKKMRITGIL